MTVDGAPVLIMGLEFAEAVGDYRAPDRGQAVLSMMIAGLTIEVATISVAERTWVTDPLTGAWTELEPGEGFNPAVLFGEEGWTALLSNVTGARIEEGGGGDYLVTATAAADRVTRLTAGIVSGQEVEIGFTVDRDTARLVSAEFTTSGAVGNTEWRIRLGPFDDPVDIEPPA